MAAASLAAALGVGQGGARVDGPVPEGDRKSWTFDDDAPNALPKGWTIAETNPTEKKATWAVMADGTAPSGPHVLALTETDNYDGTYNLAIAQGTAFQDLDLKVKVKAIAGKEDRGGGPIWRCRDANNYYICRINPLEGNFRVYVVRNGRRRQLDSAKVDLESDRWYELHVVMRGDRITCSLDGSEMLRVTDDTFAEGARIGLWTKADAVTSFDDVSVRPIGE